MTMPMTDIGGTTIVKGVLVPQDVSTDDTYVNGVIVDRIGYDSALAVAGLAVTTGSGSGSPTVTFNVQVEHGDESDLSDAAELKSYDEELDVAVDGDHTSQVGLPVSLETAKRYVRVNVKQTKAGTTTVSAALGGAHLVFGGLQDAPDALHDNDGYATSVVATA